MEEDTAKGNDTADLGEDETDTYIRPGEAGHNKPKEVVWVRWQKKRTFVRALEGTYGEVYKSLYEQPRVYRAPEMKWKGGPTLWGKKVINPQSAQISQSIEVHLSVYSPGTEGGQKHGHMNSAVFYILKGKGHDVHDGRHIPWRAGEALIVENSCVHQHFNDDPDDEAVVLVMKAKPLFLFMHMLFQKVVDYPPTEPTPGYEDYQPPKHI
ncbi:MAG: cupin domain-containing protein [Proteobacteria bacterium]|nr:cupin domain-containing protein [Pseudomonadota bacterium]